MSILEDKRMQKILSVLIITSFCCALFLKSMVYYKVLYEYVQAIQIDYKNEKTIIMKGIDDSIIGTSIDHVGKVFAKFLKDVVMVREVILSINALTRHQNFNASLDFSVTNISEDVLVNSTISTLHEDKIPLDNSLDMLGNNTQSINVTYFILGNSVASLGLFLSIFSLNPNINVFKRSFIFITKKFEEK